MQPITYDRLASNFALFQLKETIAGFYVLGAESCSTECLVGEPLDIFHRGIGFSQRKNPGKPICFVMFEIEPINNSTFCTLTECYGLDGRDNLAHSCRGREIELIKKLNE
jgi:hypothetical protein